MLLRVVITVLCGVGLYASLFMLAKTRRAELGLLEEPSVVQRPAARLYGGVPNALIGCIYYPALAIAVWFGHGQIVSLIVLIIAAFAAVTSAVLAYSLLFITKRPCPYCWAAHAVNWTLVTILFLQIGRIV
jgi:uncharacterized membrane protein